MATRRAGSQVRAGRRSGFRPQDRGFDEVLIHAAGVIGTTPDDWGNDYFDDTYYYATFRGGLPRPPRTPFMPVGRLGPRADYIL